MCDLFGKTPKAPEPIPEPEVAEELADAPISGVTKRKRKRRAAGATDASTFLLPDGDVTL